MKLKVRSLLHIAVAAGLAGVSWLPSAFAQSDEAVAQREFQAFMTMLVAVFVVAFVVVNALIYYLIVRPVRRIATVADRVSLGDMAAEDFPKNGATEIVSLTHSFNRMRKSLEKAMRMLGQ